MKKILLLSLLIFGITFGFSQKKGNQKDGARMIRVSKSDIRWWGHKVFKSEATTHTGGLQLKMGKLTFKDRILQGGEFIVDMRALTVTDLQGEEQKELLDDLKSVNFFEVRKFPMAKFEITKILPLKNEEYNSEIIGNITIKGIRKTISFPANVKTDDYKVEIESAKFSLNRQDFDIFYKSSLKDLLIKDQMDMQFSVYTDKK